jgi:hypothetical protein
MILNVFNFQVLARELILACEHSKEKNNNKWCLVIKTFQKYNKYSTYLKHLENTHQVNITQNIFLLASFFKKLKKFSKMNCINNWSSLKKWMKALKELLGYISQLGSSNPT